MNRRQFLAVSGLGLVAGCRKSSSTEGAFAGQKLRIFVYAGGHEKTMREAFVPLFEEETGATAILDTGWWDAIAKLKASPPGKPAYDLVISDETQGPRAIADGLFAQLNLKNIPNHKNLVPAALDNAVFRKRYGITYFDSVLTLAYHRGLVSPAPTTWGDLLREDLSGKFALYNSFYMSLYTFACMLAAEQKKPGTAAALINTNLQGVFRFARDNKRRVKFWWKTSGEMLPALSRKDAAACNMHTPELFQAMKNDPNIGAVVPEADRALLRMMWCVPADTPRKALAEEAINLIFSDEMQLAFARRGMATPIPGVARRMAKENAFWKSAYPHTDEQLKALRYYPYETYAKHWDDIADEWDRTVLRKG